MLRFCVVLVVSSLFLSLCSGFVKSTPNLRVAVIGAGPSGLVAAKYAIERGYNVTVYEQNDVLGGVWWYTDEIGKNEFGIDIHTSMYKGLRTNVPIRMMQYSDHVYGKNTLQFPEREVIWNYLNSYADRFDLKQRIKFTHLVTSVSLIETDEWKIVAKDLPNNKYESDVFDVVFVCNGHNSLPRIPVFDGADDFGGKMLHSHDFRNADTFVGENVLVIGTGSSGIDLVALLSATANHVTWSRRSNANGFPYKNVTYKGEVERFTKTGAKFADGSEETFSVVFYATGYNYTFPFLTKEADIRINDHFVQPLYKHVFNIEHPTMIFIGIINGLHPTFPTMEHQVRFALEYLSGKTQLPSKAEMFNDMQNQIEIHYNQYKNNRSSQFQGMEHREYFTQLSDLTNIESPPEVISSIYADNDAMRKYDPNTFRIYRYFIVDDMRYIKRNYEI